MRFSLKLFLHSNREWMAPQIRRWKFKIWKLRSSIRPRMHAYNQILHVLWYNPIRDSRRARKVSPKVSPKVSERVSARLLARLFALAMRLVESLELDYIHDSWQDSLQDSFFYAGNSVSNFRYFLNKCKTPTKL